MPPNNCEALCEMSLAGWVGFDLDHALARYRVHALQRLIYACIVRGLVERGLAPFEAFQRTPQPSGDGMRCTAEACGAHVDVESGWEGGGADCGPDNADCNSADLDHTDVDHWGRAWTPCFAPKGVCFDSRSGDLVQLDERGRVTNAWHGLRRLDAADIARRFGSARASEESSSGSAKSSGSSDSGSVGAGSGGSACGVNNKSSDAWWAFSTLSARAKHEDFACMLTFFDAPCALTLAQWVQWEDEARCGGEAADSWPPLAPTEGYGRLFRAHVPVFDHIFDNTTAWARGRGGFFAALRAQPSRYLVRRPRLAAALRARRAAGGAYAFVATNSHCAFARWVLAATLGAQWRECFDLVFYGCLKPAWFASLQPLQSAGGWRDDGVGDASSGAGAVVGHLAATLLLPRGAQGGGPDASLPPAAEYLQGNAGALAALVRAAHQWCSTAAVSQPQADGSLSPRALDVCVHVDEHGRVLHTTVTPITEATAVGGTGTASWACEPDHLHLHGAERPAVHPVAMLHLGELERAAGKGATVHGTGESLLALNGTLVEEGGVSVSSLAASLADALASPLDASTGLPLSPLPTQSAPAGAISGSVSGGGESVRFAAPRIAFVGDHIHGDVVAAAVAPCEWHTVAVVEELDWDRSDADVSCIAHKILRSTTQGSASDAFDVASGSLSAANSYWDGFLGPRGGTASHWASVLLSHAHVCVADVDHLSPYL